MSEEDVVPPVKFARRARTGRFFSAKKCCKKPAKKCCRKVAKCPAKKACKK